MKIKKLIKSFYLINFTKSIFTKKIESNWTTIYNELFSISTSVATEEIPTTVELFKPIPTIENDKTIITFTESISSILFEEDFAPTTTLENEDIIFSPTSTIESMETIGTINENYSSILFEENSIPTATLENEDTQENIYYASKSPVDCSLQMTVIKIENLKGECKTIESNIEGAYIKNCELNEKNKIKKLIIEVPSRETIFKNIGKLKDLEELYLSIYDEEDCFSYKPEYLKYLTKLKKLRDLTLERVDGGYLVKNEEKNLLNFKNLKKLTLVQIILNNNTLENISSISTLEELYLYDCMISNLGINFEYLKRLPSFKILEILPGSLNDWADDEKDVSAITEILMSISSLENLKKFVINNYNIETIPKNFNDFKKLEYLDLSYNTMTVKINQLYNLKNTLKYLDLSGNIIEDDIGLLSEFTQLEYLNLSNCYFKNVTISRSLNNKKNLKYIFDSIQYDDIYIEKKMECLNENDMPNCKELFSIQTSTIEEPTATEIELVTENPTILELPISTNGRCNYKDGRCPYGQCCSKYGVCGKTNDYCDTGCQSKFGDCHKI